MRILCLNFSFICFVTLFFAVDAVSQVGRAGGGSLSEQEILKKVDIISSKNTSFQEKEEEIQYTLLYTNEKANVEIYGINGTLLETVGIKTFLKRLKFGEYGDSSNFEFFRTSNKLFKFKMISSNENNEIVINPANSHNLNTQTQSYDKFDFIYIENSGITARDGLSQQQIDRIDALALEVAEESDHLLIVYASNENNPKFTTDALEVSNWLNNFLQNNTPFPGNKFAEKKLIREVLYASIFEVNREVNFHFFITDKYAAYQYSAMIAMLTNEFTQTLGFRGNTTANIYINNKQERKIDIPKVQEILAYTNSFESLNINIVYNIIELKL